MNDDPNANDTAGASSSVAMGFLLGALMGAGIALLLAPGSGSETRARLADAGRRWSGAARNELDQARVAVNDLKHDAESALAVGRAAFERGRKSHQEG